ncbi:hypothetical protein BC833DRAFT_624039 [Globomyces pollinis-pini]|nr:hypothetical protein BC833DRAFT_624039 [Globomyces pollinis-pini]
MAGGNPMEIFNIAGLKVQRYKLVAYFLAGSAAFVTAKIQYSKLTAKPAPVTFDSPEQEAFVKRYIAHKENESHKPVLARAAFNA